MNFSGNTVTSQRVSGLIQVREQPAEVVLKEFEPLLEARCHDPFSLLGAHSCGAKKRVRVLIPDAREVSFSQSNRALERVGESDLFQWSGAAAEVPDRYQLRWTDGSGQLHQAYDPYCFLPVIPDYDLSLFRDGRHWHLYRCLGAHPICHEGIEGVLFATWAPNAERVSVVADFNHWDGRRHPMRIRDNGVWELFIPGISPGACYKFEIRNRDSGELMMKADPYGQQFELRPRTASVVAAPSEYQWQDQEWLRLRAEADWLHAPMSIYEVHLGSWRRDEQGGYLDYREAGRQLVEHVSNLGFTHIELLPVTEHPLDASWGYQTTGYFAPTARFGPPDEFRYLVDLCHRNRIGVLLDWVPGHFPKDGFALARFDGTALYEHEDPRLGEHRDWGTLIFNYGRNEVRNFLLASALYWLEEMHLDGLRVDAVASMLYLDYSREPGDWIPNVYGGNQNLDAITFLQELNSVAQSEHPGALVIAEESTAWPQVSRPPWLGGLGFAMKWNMGWMHDTLEYFSKAPVHRRYHHDRLTFGLLYAFTENFVLPFSHDEVVHGKGAMLSKMPGDDWQRFANLRLLYSYMFTMSGKKLLFMGCEFGQWREWDHDASLDWHLLDYTPHQGLQRLVADLNRLYRTLPALHRLDFDHAGFDWIDCHDSDQSVLVYLRQAGSEQAVVALNCTPVPRFDYRLGVPRPGGYREVLNSDSEHYGGGNMGNWGVVQAEPIPWMGQPWSVNLVLPPLAALILVPDGH
ncbi:MAG: 1,4-alpha-glucan branching protein GlgB [Gammaproteobacteria bacterium]|nr:1,4-alpha-glucan branching protein GlgB [Gammaproteobacteria bacterium]